MSEEFEIESFEDLIDVFENTGDFGEYYLGNYSNIQIANYLRKMQQENKQLKELTDKYEEEHKTTFETWLKEINILTELEEWLNKERNDDSEYSSYERFTAFDEILDKIQELKEKYK